MTDLVVDTGVIEAARAAAAGAAGPARAAGEALEVLPPDVLGRLDASAVLATAVDDALRCLRTELEAAARHLEGVAAALDATLVAVRRADEAGAASLSGPPSPPAGR